MSHFFTGVFREQTYRLSYVFQHKFRSQITLELLPFQDNALISNRGCCFPPSSQMGPLVSERQFCTGAGGLTPGGLRRSIRADTYTQGTKWVTMTKFLFRFSTHPLKLEREDAASAHVQADLVGVQLCSACKGLKRNHKFIDCIKEKHGADGKMVWGRKGEGGY